MLDLHLDLEIVALIRKIKFELGSFFWKTSIHHGKPFIPLLLTCLKEFLYKTFMKGTLSQIF